jgi:hypothetical protein
MSLLQIALATMLAAQDPTATDAAEAAEIEAGAELEISAERRAYARSLGESLLASASPRERALGIVALDWDSVHRSTLARRARMLRAAAEAAPSDALVQGIWANIDSSESGCGARSPCLERQFAQARLEPENGLAWLPGFAGMDAEASDAEVESLLEKVASAERIDDHFIDGIRAWTEILASRPLPREVGFEEYGKPAVWVGHPREAEMAMAFSYAVTAFPNWLPIVKTCRRSEHAHASARRFELCAEIGRKFMQRGATLLTELIGFALVRAAGLVTPTDEATIRKVHWRQHAHSELSDTSESPEEFHRYFGDLLATGNESRAIELMMQRHGVALEPPSGWQSPGYDVQK